MTAVEQALAKLGEIVAGKPIGARLDAMLAQAVKDELARLGGEVERLTREREMALTERDFAENRACDHEERAEAAEAVAASYRQALEEIASNSRWNPDIEIARAALASSAAAGTPERDRFVPSGDERCGFVMDACTCMKRKGHDGLHACVHGGWRAGS